MYLCKQCGEIVSLKKRQMYGHFCSAKCYEKWAKYNKSPNCKCAICQVPMYIKPFKLNKNKNGVTCSKYCSNKLRAIYFSGSGNHQYGLTGDKNSSFKSYTRTTNYGYILEYAPGHPFPHDNSHKTVMVLQHRLVVEKNYWLFDQNAFITINGKHYLKKEYDVHHINEIKTDNRIENLQIMTRGEHSRLHCLQKEIIRDKKNGRIIGVLKSGKNDEPCNGNIVLTFSNGARWRSSVEHSR